MTVYTETRWLGYERCPNGDALHVLPMTISSSMPLVALKTPGNITAARACPFCLTGGRS